MQALPDSCCARAMSYLELREVSLVAQCSLKSKVRACSRELWLMLCEQRWPAIASSEALRKAVMMRHPRDYFMHMYLDCYSPRPLLDLDDHLVQLEIRQKGRSLCSVAREARDVFRSGVTEYHEQDGILIEGLRCAVDCSDDDMFPPEASRLRVTYYVIRKSDGRVAILGTDSTFGTLPGGAPIGEGFFKSFPQYPSLRGMLPMNCEYLSSLTPYVRGSCAGIGWRDTRKRDNYFEISTALFVGTDADNPGNDRVPAEAYGAGTGKPPTVVVTKGQVEIRSIFMSFSGDLYRQEPTNTREHDQYLISSEEPSTPRGHPRGRARRQVDAPPVRLARDRQQRVRYSTPERRRHAELEPFRHVARPRAEHPAVVQLEARERRRREGQAQSAGEPRLGHQRR